MIRKVTILLLTITLFASIVPHIFSDIWFIDMFSHFKVQFLVISTLLLLFSSILNNRKYIVVGGLIGIAWNSFFVIPLFLNSPSIDADEEKSLSLVCMNILSENTSHDQVRNYLIEKDPDIIVLLEYHFSWTEPLENLVASYPYRKLIPRNDHFGIALLSRIPMDIQEEKFDGSVPPTLIGTFQLGDQPVSLVATHPFPPVKQWRFELRNYQLNLLRSSQSTWSENVIVTGDLNTSSYSTIFRNFMNDGGFRDTRKGFGPQPTWPADYWPLQTTLDHCLIRGNLSVLTHQAGPAVGSDHLPIYVELAQTIKGP